MRPSLLLATTLGLGALSSQTAPNGQRPEFWEVIEEAVDSQKLRKEFDVVIDHMANLETTRANVGNRLSRVRTALSEPWTPPALAVELQEFLAHPAQAKRGAKFEALIPGVADWLDLAEYQSPSDDAEHGGLQELDSLWQEVQDEELKGMALLESLSAYLELAHILLDESIGELSGDQHVLLFEGHQGFLEAYYRNHFPGTELTDEQAQAIGSYKTLLSTPRTNRRLMLGVASGLMRLAEAEFLSGLPRRLARTKGGTDLDSYGANVLAAAGNASRNRVLLTGKRVSEHSASAALIIDLGGDDTYTRAAVVESADALVSIVLDLGGNDTYQGTGNGPASSLAGVAILVDRKGDDSYTSERFGLGASAFGFAALVDMEGDDEYSSHDFSQGHATCGVGLLYDFEGNDTYKAWAASQAGGIGYGLCALVDGGGNDSYVADLTWPDVYGNSGADVYHGASQGYSTGMRSDVAGGIAALIDLGSGKDRYQAGSFSQGGGYYFSFGLKYDGGGDDESYGSRYAQGFGVHQAVGVLWDKGGDDKYICRSVAHTGMAWDEGVGYLLEDGGDDTYQTGDLSCGGAAQTGIAICIDRGGKDSYTTGGQSQGGTGGFQYHNKPSIGVLLDFGKQKDSYNLGGRDNKTESTTTGVQVFLDR
ncbi:MAG: hypothetical protein ACI8QC_003785 [Planctomycetota bacterium]|jgi:hypothetical protein